MGAHKNGPSHFSINPATPAKEQEIQDNYEKAIKQTLSQLQICVAHAVNERQEHVLTAIQTIVSDMLRQASETLAAGEYLSSPEGTDKDQ